MKTDSQLQSDVRDELEWWPNVDAAHIGVTAADGVVTLTGEVPHYAQKQDAEDAAKAVYGVRAVANDIDVKLEGSHVRTDKDIAAAAVAALKWDYQIPEDKIQVTVKNGAVILEGIVNWQFQKDAAARSVRYLLGVVSVSNLITIKPSVKRGDVKAEIEDALRRNAILEARRISVTTTQGDVTLLGSVSSWSEHDVAVSAAWAAPGVTSVSDQLVTVP
jgi:osmotically-inducible protein OsmY